MKKGGRIARAYTKISIGSYGYTLRARTIVTVEETKIAVSFRYNVPVPIGLAWMLSKCKEAISRGSTCTYL